MKEGVQVQGDGVPLIKGGVYACCAMVPIFDDAPFFILDLSQTRCKMSDDDSLATNSNKLCA